MVSHFDIFFCFQLFFCIYVCFFAESSNQLIGLPIFFPSDSSKHYKQILIKLSPKNRLGPRRYQQVRYG